VNSSKLILRSNSFRGIFELENATRKISGCDVFGQNLVSYITKLGYNGLAEVWESNAALKCEQRYHGTKTYHLKHKTQRWNENAKRWESLLNALYA